MIKFFRKIRQNLLSEGKTGKYFKYAVGEIILVVIGILIALQINNWNAQNSKKAELEVDLKNLQTEIQHNLIDLGLGIEKLDSDIKNIEYYIDIFNQEDSSTINDSIIHMMINNLGRKRLKNLERHSHLNIMNSGIIDYIEEAKNDSLKNNILKMQNGFNTYYEYKTMLNSHLENDLRPYLYKSANFIDIKVFQAVTRNISNKAYLPLDHNSFVNNREFTNLLLIRHAINKAAKESFEYMSDRFLMIHSEIDDYLN
ncbi:hypothetical protein [Mangrovimonas sp. TPBH4]|uniref:hypothetical protein n=1 Tax=Mangrovimonas sp. TPBH4 TaxID=1645914 RepID=UPI0006B5C7A3|nr:hypothetical protein [Mangrovimonas sp. TPBH4]